MTVDFIVPGMPVGKERPRYSSVTRSVYTPTKTAKYEDFVADCYRAEYKDYMFPEDKPLIMHIEAFLPIPKGDSKKTRMEKANGRIMPTRKPDWDNIGKIIADALEGVTYARDQNIVYGTVLKQYADVPYVRVMVAEWE